MTYFNDSTNLYTNNYPAEDFDFYAYLNTPPIPQHVDNQTPDILAAHWGLERPEFAVGSSVTSVPANDESVASVAPYTIKGEGSTQQPYADKSWLPRDNVQPADFSRWDSFLPNLVGSEPSTTMLPPGSFPFGYCGDNQSGQSATAFYQGGSQPLPPSYNPGNLPQQRNVYAPRQPNSCPTGIELSSTGSLQLYGTDCISITERENAAVVPLTYTYPPVTRIGPPTSEPSGEQLPETLADPEHTKSNAEQDEAPPLKPRKPRMPNGQGKYRKYRAQTNDITPRLLKWARMRKKGSSFNGALAEALEAITMIRPVMTEGPYLRKTAVKEVAAPSKSARKERKRRVDERRLYQELSMRYPPGKKPWERSDLLAHVVQDLETHPTLRDTTENSTPETSSPAAASSTTADI